MLKTTTPTKSCEPRMGVMHPVSHTAASAHHLRVVVQHTIAITVHQRQLSTIKYLLGMSHSDVSHDRRHGLNQSATKISGPDFTIMPAYSVVRQHAGLKLVPGPHSTVHVSTVQYARVHERVRLERKWYMTVRPARKRMLRSVLHRKSA